jgi:anthranilate synthase component II
VLLLIDNFDSFTYNIADAFFRLRVEVVVIRSHSLTLSEIASLKPEFIVVGPGPKKPKDAGISIRCIQEFGGIIPILGICLGHQAINEAFGGKTVRASYPMHGKLTTLTHNQKGLFAGVASGVHVVRYHSLVACPDHFPDVLEITARSENGEIMALQHKTLPIAGLQFHPESILSESGMSMLHNFVKSFSSQG